MQTPTELQVLIVEDSPLVRRLYDQILGRANGNYRFNISAVETVQEGVRDFQARPPEVSFDVSLRRQVHSRV